jgi:hypothetical protein
MEQSHLSLKSWSPKSHVDWASVTGLSHKLFLCSEILCPVSVFQTQVLVIFDAWHLSFCTGTIPLTWPFQCIDLCPIRAAVATSFCIHSAGYGHVCTSHGTRLGCVAHPDISKEIEMVPYGLLKHTQQRPVVSKPTPRYLDSQANNGSTQS